MKFHRAGTESWRMMPNYCNRGCEWRHFFTSWFLSWWRKLNSQGWALDPPWDCQTKSEISQTLSSSYLATTSKDIKSVGFFFFEGGIWVSFLNLSTLVLVWFDFFLFVLGSFFSGWHRLSTWLLRPWHLNTSQVCHNTLFVSFILYRSNIHWNWLFGLLTS